MKKILLILCLLGFSVVASAADDIVITDDMVVKFKQDCDSNEALGCARLGFAYANGKGVKQNYFKANKYYKKACDLDYAEGCYNLGFLYDENKGVLGFLYDENKGVSGVFYDEGKQNYFKANKYYKKACDLDYANGCAGLGFLYDEGKGVRQDFCKAKEFYGKACDLGLQKGCDWYKEKRSEWCLW